MKNSYKYEKGIDFAQLQKKIWNLISFSAWKSPKTRVFFLLLPSEPRGQNRRAAKRTSCVSQLLLTAWPERICSCFPILPTVSYPPPSSSQHQLRLSTKCCELKVKEKKNAVEEAQKTHNKERLCYGCTVLCCSVCSSTSVSQQINFFTSLLLQLAFGSGTHKESAVRKNMCKLTLLHLLSCKHKVKRTGTMTYSAKGRKLARGTPNPFKLAIY